jgi:hypothetical protein
MWQVILKDSDELGARQAVTVLQPCPLGRREPTA